MDSIHPARRFAILAHEFGRRSLNIIALPEIRLPKECYRKELGFTFYWRGKSGESKRESCVGFAIKSKLAHRLEELPRGVSDRKIMVL